MSRFLLHCLIFTWVLMCSHADAAVTIGLGGAPAEIAYWQELLQTFEEDTGIEVELLRQPTDTDLRRQGLMVALQAEKSDPDLFLMDIAWLAQFAASGWLHPLDKAGSDGAGIDRDVFFTPVINQADTYEGQLVALPVYVDGGLLYYRKDLLEKNGFDGPPETWDELVSMGKLVQLSQRTDNQNFYGFVWQGAQYEGLICNFMEFAGQSGGFEREDGRIVVDTPANRRALSLMRDLIWEHRLSPPNTYTEMKEEETRLFFQKGNALFERNWPYAWPLHQEPSSPVQGKTAIAPLPAFESGGSVSTLGGWHLGVSAYSDALDESMELVAFITSYEVQKKLALALGWNPGRKDVYEDREVLKTIPHFEDLRAVFEMARPRPILPYYTQISSVLQRHVNSVLAGTQKPGEALQAAQQEIDLLVRRYGR